MLPSRPFSWSANSMGQANGSHADAAQHTSATGSENISATDWSQQVLAEYSKLQGEAAKAEGPSQVHLSAAGGPVVVPVAGADGTPPGAHADAGTTENLLPHAAQSMDARMLTSSMHEVQQILGPSVLPGTNGGAAATAPPTAAADAAGADATPLADSTATALADMSGGGLPASQGEAAEASRPALEGQTSEETTATSSLPVAVAAVGATEALEALSAAASADTGDETVPPRKRKRPLHAEHADPDTPADGSVAETEVATIAEATVAGGSALTSAAVAERGGQQEGEGRGVSRRTTHDTTASGGSLAELNLTMEAALSALYDDSLSATTATSSDPYGPGGSHAATYPVAAEATAYPANPAYPAAAQYAPPPPVAYSEPAHAGAYDPYGGAHYMQPQYAPAHAAVAYAPAAPAQPIAYAPYPAPYGAIAYSTHGPPLAAATATHDADEGEVTTISRLVWSPAEDALILRTVEQLGPKWRKIAALLPNRSDDAVRNRWHRLSEAQRSAGAAAAAAAPGAPADGSSALEAPAAIDRSSVYRCSRCGQPKKSHVCTAPSAISSGEQAKMKKIAAEQTQAASGNADQRSAWTKIEDEIILSSVREFGPKWIDIAMRLPGRTEHAARNRYHRLSQRAPTH